MLIDQERGGRLHRTGIVGAGHVDDASLDAARRVAAEILPAGRDPLHFSTGSPDHAYRARLSAALGEALAPAVASHLDGASYLFGVLVSQRAGAAGMGRHHDLSFVEDEDRHRAVVAWIPLADVDRGSGALLTLPGSHALVRNPRGTPTFPSPFDHLSSDEVEGRMTPVEERAGSITFTDPRLLHASSANRADHERVAAVLVFVPDGVPLVHHFRWPDGRVEAFAVDRDFYTAFRLDAPPEGYPSLGDRVVEVTPVDRGHLAASLPPPERPQARGVA